MVDDCLQCQRVVRPKQEAMQCHECERWQHRTCGTGVSQERYRATVRGDTGGLLTWYCQRCTIPDLEPPQLERSDVAPHRFEPITDDPPVLEISSTSAIQNADAVTIQYGRKNDSERRKILAASFDLHQQKNGQLTEKFALTVKEYDDPSPVMDKL